MRPKTEGILESSLYVSNLLRSVRFYEKAIGFRVISEFDDRGCAMHAGTHQVLLLFKKGASRMIRSPHDGYPNRRTGQLGIVAPHERRIVVEEKREWELGGRSLYFRDPGRHLVELATPGTWPVY